MTAAFTLFAVEDDAMIQDILRAILEPRYQLEIFTSAEACSLRLHAARPDCFLLDIGLPGMDGYQFCRLLKNREDVRDIPVTFISSHDTIEARLKGYDAGGDDFIVKPFEPEELLRKVRVAEQSVAQRRALEERAENADKLSSMAFASMGDSGLVLQFMTRLLTLPDEQSIANGMIDILWQFSVEGVVQTRLGNRSHTVSRNAVNAPLEVAVMNHVHGLDRIFEFHNRTVYNFENITVMVNNMPIDDPVLCGRIRDNLALAAQGASARLSSLDIEERSHRHQAGITQALETLEATLEGINQANLHHRYQVSQLIYQFDQELAGSFMGIGLSDSQEAKIESVVSRFTQALISEMDQGEGLQQTLSALTAKLHNLRA